MGQSTSSESDSEGEFPPTTPKSRSRIFVSNNNNNNNIITMAEENRGSDTEFDGLGINFYRVDGKMKRDGDSEAEAEAEAGTNVGRAPSLPEAHQPLPNDFDPDLKQSLHLTDELLEEQYRGQANSFTRTSSRSTSRSVAPSPSPRSTSSNLASPPINNPPDTDSPPLNCKPSSTFYTPTRQPSKGESFASVQRKLSLGTPSRSDHKIPDTPGADRRIFSNPAPLNLCSFKVRSSITSGLSPQLGASHSPYSPHYGHRIRSVSSPVSAKLGRSTIYYFTEEERLSVAAAVEARRPLCDHHEDCISCLDKEYAYFENKIMPTSMPPEDRQKIINNNRSLRNIKNELENLIEQNVITDQTYDLIMKALPSESPLNGSLPVPRNNVAPSPSPSAAPSAQMSRMNVNTPPPAYTNGAPPPPPARNPTPQPPQKPEIARAVALYRYAEPEDCTFEVGDQISVYEYMNPEWWLGRNIRTGKEGVFPMNYVQVQTPQQPQGGFYGDQKQNVGGYPGQPQYAQQAPPPAPSPSNPYNSEVPPMAVAEGGQSDSNKQPSKGSEMGKKFGKKLGNAAIFGAGATIGGNIVNSIF